MPSTKRCAIWCAHVKQRKRINTAPATGWASSCCGTASGPWTKARPGPRSTWNGSRLTYALTKPRWRPRCNTISRRSIPSLRSRPANIRVIHRREMLWAVVGPTVQNTRGGRTHRHRRLRLRSAAPRLRSGSGGSQQPSTDRHSALDLSLHIRTRTGRSAFSCAAGRRGRLTAAGPVERSRCAWQRIGVRCDSRVDGSKAARNLARPVVADRRQRVGGARDAQVSRLKMFTNSARVGEFMLHHGLFSGVA
jgi:hypothetical protein